MSITEATEGRFPVRLEDVSPAWLDERLHQAGALGPGEKVAGFRPEPLGEGFGMMSTLARLNLDYEEGSGSVGSLIFKSSSSVESNRAVADTFDVYHREVGFYTELGPKVSSVIPACWYGDIDQATNDSILLLEDLGDYRRGDQAAGCDEKEAELCVDTMALIHATWFDRTGEPGLEWVPRIDGPMYSAAMPAAVEASWDQCITLFGDVIPADIASAKERYVAGLPGLHHRMGTGHQALLHGDFRLDNLLFAAQPGHRPLVVVDWQGLIVSKPTQDLAYLLTQNLTIESRRDHEQALLDRYLTALSAHGVTTYGRDELESDYRLAALIMWEYAIVIGGALDPSNDRGRAFMRGLLERSAAAITDHDLFSLL